MLNLAEATDTVNHDAAWIEACKRVSDLAHAKLPEAMHGRIQRGTALAISHGVFFEEDETCQVRGSKEGVWHIVNGHCDCEDYLRAPDGRCKHRIARWISIKATEMLQAPQALEDNPPAHGIRAEHIVTIQGKLFVKFAGLLERAHEEGLQTLTAAWTFNDANLSLATATAVFDDGRCFTEAGDSAKDNVGSKVAAHWRRVSLTRAKARCLRDALGCDLVAAEELAHE